MFVGNIEIFEDHAAVLLDEERIETMRKGIDDGNVYIFKRVVPEEMILRARHYLHEVGRYSLPNYQSIEPNCPNFHRVDQWDERAYVRACVHSFSFFPWNHDMLGFFKNELFRSIYNMKNLLSGKAKDSFLGLQPQLGCTARLSFQHYPVGGGGINKHQDPYDIHQTTVPSMTMSKYGHDYKSGGLFVERAPGVRVNLDKEGYCDDYGDVIYFNAKCIHGVELVDPDVVDQPDWLSPRGRWIALFTVNKLAGNKTIQDSKDLGD